jgi:hypothetical protein
MGLYTVQWNYRTQSRGPWAGGEVIDISDAEAIAINKDSPGVLVPVRVAAPAARVLDAAPNDRMVKGAGRRRAIALED